MLEQERPKGIEHAVYYLSKKLLPYEEKYDMAEKICLIIIWATKQLRHYFQSYKIQAFSKIDPLRYLFQVPALTEKMSRWLVLLTKFDIQYIMTKVIKGRTVAEFLALNAVEGEEQWNLEFPYENIASIVHHELKLYFDRAINNRGAGLGVILVMPKGETIPMAKNLDFKVTNNMAEYEACIYGVEVALAAGAKDLLVYGDSLLIISQANEEWKVKDERLKPYNGYLKMLMKGFDKCLFIHLPRDEN